MGDTLSLVFGTLFLKLDLTFYNVVLVEENDIVILFRANRRVEFLRSQLSDVVLFDFCIVRFCISRFRDMDLNFPILEDQDLIRLFALISLFALLSRIIAEAADYPKFSVKQEEIFLLIGCNGPNQFFIIYLI